MKSLNKVQLIGYVGNEPKNDVLPNGIEVLRFSVATSETKRDKTTGDKTDHTEWHQVVFFNHGAKNAKIFVKKGARLYIDGKINYQKWVNKEGKEMLSTQIIGEDFVPLDKKNEIQSASAIDLKNIDFDDSIPF